MRPRLSASVPDARPGLARGRGLVHRARTCGPGLDEAVTLVADTHVPDAAFAAGAAFERPNSRATIAISLINAYNRIAISFRRGPASAPPGQGETP
jgi:hypothetical protein